jgi:glyceraldehyde 3-phosphate dehydrogenase
LLHLFEHDTTYGRFELGSPTSKWKSCFFQEPEPGKLPWKDLDIDVVLECSGAFTKMEDAKKHLDAGAKKVIVSAPSESAEMPTYLLGVNEKNYKGENIISMGSCTTNCLAPVVKILNENIGIENGFMTTVHSYTNDQRVLDLPHKDLRRARTAGLNIIPTTTGAAKTVAKVIPELAGKLDGISLRVPTAIVSITDFICQTKKATSVEEVNELFKKAAQGELRDILDVSDKPLVSMDFKGNPNSSIVDLPLTMVKDNLVKVVAWYDNEWGYACRLAEMAEFIMK